MRKCMLGIKQRAEDSRELTEGANATARRQVEQEEPMA
jgi:hypothetical protein